MTCRRVAMILSLALAFLASGATVHANPSGVAVIIGNRHYQGAVPEVSYAHRDAEAFKRYVVDTLGYDPANVIDLRDATQSQMVATFGNEASAQGNLWSYLDPAGGSDVLVFYSGHGVPGQRDGKGYLLPADADPNVPELNAYPIDLLYANLAKLDEAGSVAVFLDACFSGGSQRGMLIENASPVYVSAALPTTVAGAMTVLTAASGGQLASWDTTAGHGMFTHHLLDALYGKGDADADGRVSAAEAKRYLDRHMTRAARRAYKRNQVASLLGDGDMPLAFSGDAGFGSRPTLGPGGVSAADIEELDGVRWAKQRANLRSGPSTEHPVAGSLDAGEEVAVKGRVRGGEWLLVATAEGGEAFVFARLLADQPPSARRSPPTSAPARDTAQETAFWESVKDGDVAGFEAYLQQFPNGAFAPLALARLRQLVWAPIENSTGPKAFEEYLANDPDGHFAELARAALRQHIERSDKPALDRYLSRYPQGAAADLARERLPAAEWESIRHSAQPRVFEEYLAAKPSGPFAEPARAALLQRIEQSDKSALDRYLSRYPRGAAADLARERLPAAAWEKIRGNGDFRVFGEYLRQYPGSAHEGEARRRLRDTIGASSDVDALETFVRQQPTSEFAEAARQHAATLVWRSVAHSLRASDFDAFLRRYPNSREASLVPGAKAALERLAASFDTFVEKDGIGVGRDCAKCPEMVVVPAGSYRMGSEDGASDERPVHEVTIGAPFAVGRYEVTFAEWDACGRGCPRGRDIRPLADDEGWGRGRRPVINVSWDDAKRYVQWLSRKTKKPYRLLSESEWEYAARAGTQTAYSWGDEIGVNRANCDGCGSQWDDSKTAPVGSFGANAWGLYDMHGNVTEWVADCWNDSYAGAPADGSAWLTGNCAVRVLRGGSWYNNPSFLRAAYRIRNSTGIRSIRIGFRVARTLTP